MRPVFIAFSLSLITSCTQVPEGVEPVHPFDLTRYLGQWHEIARLDPRTQPNAHKDALPTVSEHCCGSGNKDH